MKYTIPLHLSDSFIHVPFLHVTRATTYKLRWNCDVLLEPIDFQNLPYIIHVELLTLNRFTVLCGTKEALQSNQKLPDKAGS